MKQIGMLLLAVALGIGAWWWFTAEMPRRERARARAAEQAAAQAERANSLYRWRDAAGNLQVTDAPPTGRPFQRISRDPQDGIEIHGARN